MQLSQSKSTPRSRQTFFRLHMQTTREIFKYYFRGFFCGIFFLVVAYNLLAWAEVCGRLMCPGVTAWKGVQVATGGLEIMLCIAPGAISHVNDSSWSACGRWLSLLH